MYDTDPNGVDLSNILLKAASSETFMSSFGALVGKSPASSIKRKIDSQDDDKLCHYCREHGHMHHTPDHKVVTCPVLKAKLLKEGKVDASCRYI